MPILAKIEASRHARTDAQKTIESAASERLCRHSFSKSCDGFYLLVHCAGMRQVIGVTTLLGIFFIGCGSDSTSTDGSGGSSVGTGGQVGSGGSSSSASATGGATAATGGVVAGGSQATGGTAAATGGDPGTGGKATGGASTASTGGKATGGKSSTGGNTSSATGGKSTAGGSTSTGGQATVGGKSSTGGTTAAGGQPTGGTSSVGGTTAAGGQATGGKSTAGGSSATGGEATGGGTSTSSGKSAGCGKTPGISSSQYNNGNPISITAGGKQRRYVLQVPTNYDNNHAYRLVVVYHQLDGNDKQMYNWQYYGLLPLSNNSTIFVAPNGQKNGSPCTGTGDGDSGCGWPNSSDSDLALADAVVAETLENFCIDTDRIFATGWSYGGSMSYRTACSRPQGGTAAWGVRGVAVYAAAPMSGNCTPGKPVAYFGEHGTRDSVLCYDGGSTGCQVNINGGGVGLAQSYASVNGCNWATPTKVTSGAHVCTNIAGCDDGYPVRFCSFNGDHTPFPDNGQAQGSWGPQEAWTFLSQF